MKYFHIIFKYIVTINFLLYANFAHAITKRSEIVAITKIYCATSKKNWEWLKVNGSITEVTGKWVELETTFNGKYLFLKYFSIDGGLDKINLLRKKCIENFGSNFQFAQPADGSLDNWYLLGTSDAICSAGHFQMKYACNHCIYRNSGKYIIGLTNNNVIDFNKFTEYYFAED